MDIWHKTKYVRCTPNHGKLTLGSCLINQEQALIGARALLSSIPVSDIPKHQVERFMACSECGYCTVDLPVVRALGRLRSEFAGVSSTLENFDWYQQDSDVRAERDRRKNRQGWQRQLRARA